MFGISIFTVRRIIKQFESNTKREEIYSRIRWNKLIRSPKVRALISKYVRSISWSFTSSDIQMYILKEWSVLIPNHQIRKHLKSCERLSFKKGSSRPYALDVDKQKLQKQLFWVRLSQKLSSIKMLINLDESTINKDTKNNYSKLKIGKHCSINNIIFKGSMNLISWITTSGLAVNLLKYTTSNSSLLIKFLKQLFEWLSQTGIHPDEIGIILDNWAFHRSKYVKSFWQSIGVKLYYLPAYAPELTPVELYFSQLKSSLIKRLGMEQMNLKSETA